MHHRSLRQEPRKNPEAMVPQPHPISGRQTVSSPATSRTVSIGGPTDRTTFRTTGAPRPVEAVETVPTGTAPVPWGAPVLSAGCEPVTGGGKPLPTRSLPAHNRLVPGSNPGGPTSLPHALEFSAELGERNSLASELGTTGALCEPPTASEHPGDPRLGRPEVRLLRARTNVLYVEVAVGPSITSA